MFYKQMTTNYEIYKRLERINTEFNIFRETIGIYKYVSLFGVGQLAESWGYNFVKEWSNNDIVCFSDNNPNMWGKTIIDGLKCVPPGELSKYGDDMIVVILVEKCHQKAAISKQLEAENIKSIGIKMEWFYTDCLIEKYLDIQLPAAWNGSMDMGRYKKDINRDKKIAVYTCITGGYDDLIQPLVEDPRCDYYLLGLNKPENIGVYKWVDITGKIPECISGDYHRMNRYCKIHPNIFFPQYDYSIYVDGNIQINTIISHLPGKLGKVGIASYGIGGVADIYEHAASLWYRNGKGELDGRIRIQNQMKRYVKEGFPRFFGLTENGVLVREHNNGNCIRIMDTWWDEVLNYSRRDQLSFMYAIWKNGFTPQDIGYLGDTFRTDIEFSSKKHNIDNNFKIFNRQSSCEWTY